jgi:hypothetical protein
MSTAVVQYSVILERQNLLVPLCHFFQVVGHFQAVQVP